MIGYIEGTLIGHNKDSIVLKAGQMGYKVYTRGTVHLKLTDSPLSLWTYLAVRETALDLYGFEDKEELVMFELLLTVSGIGPRSALATLDTAGLAALKRGILSTDPAVLTKVSGIGKKTAEKIVQELKGKIEDDGIHNHVSNTALEAIDALISLGYSERAAREAVENIDADEYNSTQEMIKHALKHIQ